MYVVQICLNILSVFIRKNFTRIAPFLFSLILANIDVELHHRVCKIYYHVRFTKNEKSSF